MQTGAVTVDTVCATGATAAETGADTADTVGAVAAEPTGAGVELAPLARPRVSSVTVGSSPVGVAARAASARTQLMSMATMRTPNPAARPTNSPRRCALGVPGARSLIDRSPVAHSPSWARLSRHVPRRIENMPPRCRRQMPGTRPMRFGSISCRRSGRRGRSAGFEGGHDGLAVLELADGLGIVGGVGPGVRVLALRPEDLEVTAGRVQVGVDPGQLVGGVVEVVVRGVSCHGQRR